MSDWKGPGLCNERRVEPGLLPGPAPKPVGCLPAPSEAALPSRGDGSVRISTHFPDVVTETQRGEGMGSESRELIASQPDDP